MERQRIADDHRFLPRGVELDPVEQGEPNPEEQPDRPESLVGQAETEPVGGIGLAEAQLAAGRVEAEPAGHRRREHVLDPQPRAGVLQHLDEVPQPHHRLVGRHGQRRGEPGRRQRDQRRDHEQRPPARSGPPAGRPDGRDWTLADSLYDHPDPAAAATATAPLRHAPTRRPWYQGGQAADRRSGPESAC